MMNGKFLSALALVCLCSATLKANDPAKDAGELQWKRTPEWTIPYLSTAPSIDGTVSLNEWLAAAKVGPLLSGKQGLISEYDHTIRLGYDDRNIYLAFSINRPKETPHPATPNEEGRLQSPSFGNIDAVEILLAPELDFYDTYDFIIFGNGAFGDAHCDPNKDNDWDADWEKAVRLTDTGWEGEIAIPFKAFGLDGPPSPMEWWGFDFVDNRRTPFTQVAYWSYRGNIWHQFWNFGRIRFAKVPAVQLNTVGKLPNGQHGIGFSVANGTSDLFGIKTQISVSGRDTSDSTIKSYYDNIESGVSHDSQVEFAKNASLIAMIEFAEEQYQPVEGGAEATETIEVSKGVRKTFGFGSDLPLGEYLVQYRVTTGNDQVLASGASVFEIVPPLSLSLEPYWLYSQVIDVFADTKALDASEGGVLKVSLIPAESQQPVISEVSQSVDAGDDEVKLELPVKDLEAGFYRVKAEYFLPNGELLATNITPVERPATPPWFKNEKGNQIEVPGPWTPVVAETPGDFQVWGRDYDLSTVFPASVVSNGVEVLSAPVTLQAQTGSGSVDWKVTKMEAIESSDGGVTYDVTLSAKGLELSGTLRAEFDGLLWYDLELAPTDAPVDIESMSLGIQVNPELCELMGRHKFLVDPLIQSKVPEPELNGAPGFLEHAKIPFTPYLWIGNETAGMGFIAEAPIDWSIDKPNAVLETLPPQNGKGGELLAHIIQKPISLDKPMRLQFGLQATPIRETPKDRGILNIYQKLGVVTDEEVFKRVAELGGKVFVFYYSWRGNSTTELGGTPERPVEPEQREKLKKGIELAHKYGMKAILYTGWGVNASSKNWQDFSYELGKYPIENKGWGAYAQSAGENGAYVDFMAWGHADIAKEYGADGVLWDSTANLQQDQNARIGNAWVDSEGRTRPKYGVLATRELYRRVYSIYHGEVVEDGIIYNHTGSMWPINIYADIQNRGEGRPMYAQSLRESWMPFEEFRSEYSAEPFGNLYSGEINDWEDLPMRVSTHSAVTLLHGTYAKEYTLLPVGRYRSYDWAKRPLYAYWDTFDWVPMDGSQTSHYYYENEAGHYQAVPVSDEALLSSAFISDDKERAVVVVTNLDKKPIEGVTVDLRNSVVGKALGEDIEVIDGVTLETIEMTDGVVNLDILPERYRLLRVSSKKPLSESVEG